MIKMKRTTLLNFILLTLACGSLLATSAPLNGVVNKLQLATTAGAEQNGFKTTPHLVKKTEGIISKLTCELCELVAEEAYKHFNEGKTWDEIATLVGDVCTKLKIQDEKVCKAIAFEFEDEVLTVVRDVGLDPKELCAVLLNGDCGSGYDPWDQEWTIALPPGKPPVNPVPTPPEGAPVIRILQISDMHYDPLYAPGHSNNCNEPLCCRKDNAKVSDHTAAGYWGDYNCDVPYHTINNLMEHLFSIRDQFDWVYWTGDLPAHNVWNQTRNDQLTIMKEMVDLMKKFLPDKIVFPSFGNHESAPVNSFPPPYITGDQSLEWLLDPTLSNWTYWLGQLPDWPNAEKAFSRGGFYNVKVRDGLRVISLQTNYCNTGNFWLLINSTDPGNQLQWLVEQLLQAEKEGDKVHILGHIPPGMKDCNPVYARNYVRIVNRFESTIVGQFMGHTHTDFFELFFEENSTRATNVLFIAPGVTSYKDMNLGFRIYTIDGVRNGSTFALLDHETYFLNLTKANALPPTQVPQWEFEYSAKNDLKMKGLQPADFADLLQRLNTSDELFLKYMHYLFKAAYAASSVNPASRAEQLCAAVTTVHGDATRCKQFLPPEMSMMELALYSASHKQSMC